MHAGRAFQHEEDAEAATNEGKDAVEGCVVMQDGGERMAGEAIGETLVQLGAGTMLGKQKRRRAEFPPLDEWAGRHGVMGRKGGHHALAPEVERGV